MRTRRPDVDGVKAMRRKAVSLVPTLDALRLQELDGAPSWRELIPGVLRSPCMGSYDALRRFATPRLTRVAILRLHRRAPHPPQKAKKTTRPRPGAEQRFDTPPPVLEQAWRAGHRPPFGEAAPRPRD